MGNSLTQIDPKKAKKFEAYLEKFPRVAAKSLLRDEKLFRTYSLLVEREASIIMKVHIVGDKVVTEGHERSLNNMRDQIDLNLYPGLLPYTKLIVEEAFVALIRPKIYRTLQQRIHTVPLLRKVEKLWIIFQAMTALYNLHMTGYYHGNINSNNIFLTTWNHVYLGDFAWYAPNYLLDEKLDDKNYYYPSSMRKCNLAPEKFISKDDKSKVEISHDNIKAVKLETIQNLQKMDIFSLGCVIAEIMLDGRSLFNYEQMVAYKRGEYDPTSLISEIKDPKIEKIILDMIRKDPNQRESILHFLQRFSTEICPESFYKLTYYINTAISSHSFVLPDQRIGLIRQLLPAIYDVIIREPYVPHYETLPLAIQDSSILKVFQKHLGKVQPQFSYLFNDDSDTKTDDLIEENKKFDKGKKYKYEGMANIMEKVLKEMMTDSQEPKSPLKVKNRKSSKENGAVKKDLLLIVLMICSNLRCMRYFMSLQVALEMLSNFALFLNDHTKLHVIVPYLFCLIEEQTPQVVVLAFNTVMDILRSIKRPIKFNSDRKLFEDYIKPNLSKVHQQSLADSYIGAAYAERLYQIIDVGVLFTTNSILYNVKNQKSEIKKSLNENQDEEIEEPDQGNDDFNPALADTATKELIKKETDKIREEYARHIQDLASSNTPETMEPFIRSLPKLADSLGPKLTEQHVIFHAIAPLNSPDGKIKLLCLEVLHELVNKLPTLKVNEILKPCLEKVIFDADERVVFQGVRAYNEIIKSGKLTIFDPQTIIRNFLPLTIHPNTWIREEVIELISNFIERLDIIDLYQNLHPALLMYVKNYEELVILNGELFKLVVVDPISRRSYEEIKSKNTVEKLFNDSQTRDLAAILNEHFIMNIKNSEAESTNKSSKGEVIKIEPKHVMDLQSIIDEFCRQVNSKHIKELATNYSGNLTELVLKEEDKELLANKKQAQPDNPNDVKTYEKLKEIRNLFNVQIAELLKMQNVNIITYIENIHRFYLFVNSLIIKYEQLEKKTKKSVGYHERSERITHPKPNWEPSGFLVKTIYEHNDSVNCLDATYDSKYFASASDDGEIKIFDINKIESDFTCNSIMTINCNNHDLNDEEKVSKIKCIKFLDDQHLLYGTTNGKIELHRIDKVTEADGKSKVKANFYRRFQAHGEIKALQSLILGNQQRDKNFMYITHKGELGIQDINDPNVSLKFDLGKERGMISTMLMTAMDYTVAIGTYSGYVLLYDIRANLISNVYQLNNEAPILSFCNHHQLEGKPLNVTDTQIGISFGSDYHEVGFWNFYDFTRDVKNPEFYLYCSPSPTTECAPAYLKDLTRTETIFNVKNSFKERIYYDNLTLRSPIYNILNYFTDSINYLQEIQREKWLAGSKNIYNKISKAYMYKNSAHKIVSIPNFPTKDLRNGMTPNKDLQNIILTAGNDLNLRYWNLSNDKKYQIHNSDGKRRNYHKTNTDLIIHYEYMTTDNDKSGFSTFQYRNGYSLTQGQTTDKHILAQAGHRDVINDILVMDKNDLIITCGRDKTVKIWK